ncbi:hypothetical protein JCM3770_003885 [Rhodotorula araucariae]
MQTRRRREASTLSDWPHLSLLAVYRETAILDDAQQGAELDDAALEEAKVLFLASPGGGEAFDARRRARMMGTVIGVAAFARTLAPEGAEPVRAVHSSRRRMLWIEPEPGYLVHATIAIPRPTRHARNASAAKTNSTAFSNPAPFSLDDDVLLAGLRHAYHEYRLRFGSFAGVLDQDGKARLKERLEGFWGEWVERWDVAGEGPPSPLERVLDAIPRCSLLTPAATSQLLPLLSQFAASNPSVLPILLHDTTVVSLPVLSCVRGSSTRADHAPPPPLTQADLLALVRYLHRLLPRRSLATYADASSAAADASSHAAAAEPGSSSWTAPFVSLKSGVTSLLAPRPLALSRVPASTVQKVQKEKEPALVDNNARASSLRAGFAALRRSDRDAVARRRDEAAAADTDAGAGGPDRGWSLRSVSAGWGRFGFGGASAAVGARAPGAEEEAQMSTAEANTEAAFPRMAAAEEPPAPETVDAGGVDCSAEPLEPDEAASEPTTPAVELAPAVDMDELAAAMGATSSYERADAEILPSTEESDGGQEGGPEGLVAEPAERDCATELLCGDGPERDTRFHLRRYERGSLTLALALLPDTDAAALAWLDSRAERLLEAVESLLEVVEPPAPVYPQRHLHKHGLLASSFSPSAPVPAPASAAAATAAAAIEELATTSALLDAFRALHSARCVPAARVVESLTRLTTPAAPWVVHRCADAAAAAAGPAPTLIAASAEAHEEVYAVLTAAAGSTTGGGRGARGELSLVEAADEARRVLAAYRA